MNEQQAGIIEHLPVDSLKPHPKNVAIYGQDGYKDLVDSIRELGVMQALYITPQRVIISGHRRWYAAKEAGLLTIPTITVKYADDFQERQAIIEHNRYRVKNGQQLYNESVELKHIEAKRAAKRKAQAEGQPRGAKQEPSLPQTFGEEKGHEKETDAIVAKAIGLGSGEQLRKLEYVAEHKPKLLKEIKQGGRSLESAYKEVKRVDRQNDLDQKPPQELVGKYNVFYADPPWQYDNNSTAIRGMADDAYPTWSLDKIKAFPIQAHVLDDAVLFFWTTTSMLRNAFEVIDAWGFTFKTSMVWVKDRIGTGFFVRSKHEYVLIATKGSFLPMTTELPESVIFAPKTKHSKKPGVFYSIIEKMYPKQRYCELFARQKRTAWFSWGNEL